MEQTQSPERANFLGRGSVESLTFRLNETRKSLTEAIDDAAIAAFLGVPVLGVGALSDYHMIRTLAANREPDVFPVFGAFAGTVVGVSLIGYALWRVVAAARAKASATRIQYELEATLKQA